MENIQKNFPGVRAFKDVSLEICPGEVHALIGENGAGKSTLMKILSGAYKKDGGKIFWMDEEVDLGDETNFIDTGYEIVDINNYEEVWKTKTPW